MSQKVTQDFVEVDTGEFKSSNEHYTSVDVSMAEAFRQNPGSYKLLNPDFESNGYIPEKSYFRLMALLNPLAHRICDYERISLLQNGYEIITTDQMDAERVKIFCDVNRFHTILSSTLYNQSVYGGQAWQIYNNPDKLTASACPFKISLLPEENMRPIQDEQGKIVWDKDHLKGYEVTENEQVKQQFKYENVVYFMRDVGTLGSYTGISALQRIIPAIQILESVKIQTPNIIDRALPTRHITMAETSKQGLDETLAEISANTKYPSISVTSDKVKEEVLTASTAQFDLSKYLDPMRAEIAASQGYPIEQVVATVDLKTATNDFKQRIQEGMKGIKERQKVYAETLTEFFTRWICVNPVEFKFNDPTTIDIDQKVKNIGFLKQNHYSNYQIDKILNDDWSVLRHDKTINVASGSQLMLDDVVYRAGEFIFINGEPVPVDQINGTIPPENNYSGEEHL